MDKKAALTSLIGETEDALSELQARAKALEEALAAVHSDIAERKQDLDAFKQAYARYTGESLPPPIPVTGGHLTMEQLARTIEMAGTEKYGDIENDMEAVRWRALPRIDAVESVLADASAPLHRHEVTELLHSHGRTDDVEDVSAALSFLSRNGRAGRTDGNRWVAIDVVVDQPPSTTEPAT